MLDPLRPKVSPAASGGACCTASKLTSDDSWSSVVWSKFTWACSTLRLRDEERCREPDLVAPLLSVEALLGQRRAGACGIDTFGGALYLPAGLPDGLGSLESQARDPLCRLPPLDLRP